MQTGAVLWHPLVVSIAVTAVWTLWSLKNACMLWRPGRAGCTLVLSKWKNTPGAPSYCLVASGPLLLIGLIEYASFTRKLYHWCQHDIIVINIVNQTTPSWRICPIVKTSTFITVKKRNRKYWNISAHQMPPLYVSSFRVSRNIE